MTFLSVGRPAVVCVSVFVLVGVASSSTVSGQNRFTRMAVKTAVCGGAAWGGYKLGEKIANASIAKMKLQGAEAEKARRSIQIGTAAALCGTGVLLTGTVYNTLSERDRKARDKEMAAALEDANPGTRNYVLPDSKREGRLDTDLAVQDGDRVCRHQVDFIAGESEPATTRWCRPADKPNSKFELALGV